MDEIFVHTHIYMHMYKCLAYEAYVLVYIYVIYITYVYMHTYLVDMFNFKMLPLLKFSFILLSFYIVCVSSLTCV